MNRRIAIINGIRSPFCRANGAFKDHLADDLGTYVLKELIARIDFSPNTIDEVIVGNVLQPSHATNIARVISIKANLSEKIPAFTVNRNCSSGMEAVVTGANKILLEDADIIVAGGVESMSHFPILFPKQMRDFLLMMNKAKSFLEKMKVMASFRLSFLKPEMPQIADPLCGLSMGQTAELLARDFKISRLEQDQFALESQRKAARAIESNRFQDEIVPVPIAPHLKKFQLSDEGPRLNQTLESLQNLKPAFEKINGTVTAGNSSPITDGAAFLLLMSESKAKSLGLKPLGYLLENSLAALDPNRMGLGPIYAIDKLLKKTQLTLDKIDLIEINEAFAAQILAIKRAAASDDFARKALDREKALGEINTEKLNVNGGAISLGHPLGASGARLILTLLLELKLRRKKLGIASLCVGGGQGQACLLEANL